MTVAPPLSRLHLVPAVIGTVLLCSSSAWPALADPPAGKGPPAHSHGAARHAAKHGHAVGHARNRPSTRGRSHAPARAQHSAPRGQLKKAAKAAATAQATTTAAASAAGTTATASAAGAKRPSATAARRTAARRRAAAARRRAAAAERRAAATTAARRAQLETAAQPAGTAQSRPAAPRTKPKKEHSRPPFLPVHTEERLPQPLLAARDVVEVVPAPLRALVAGLAAVSILLALAYGLTLMRNRRLAGQRRELLGRVGLLQAALLPELPENLGSCTASVAYRPADGPGAGGDFYDVLPLAGGKTAVLIGDVSGHGRAALGRTALARYTLRAYLEAGLEPREALQIAGSVMAGKLEGDFVTALLAVHDAGAGTLTYATAGHPPPIVISSSEFDPVVVATAPPLGVGTISGQRQTTLPFPRGAIACFYTDGLSEARTGGKQLGAAGLEQIVRELGPDVTAEQVIDRVAGSARTVKDDAAACVIRAEDGASIVRTRVERLEVSRAELRGPMLREFLDACGVSVHGIRAAERDAREMARRMGGAILEVRMGEPSQVDVLAPDLPVGDDVMASLHQPSAPGR